MFCLSSAHLAEVKSSLCLNWNLQRSFSRLSMYHGHSGYSLKYERNPGNYPKTVCMPPYISAAFCLEEFTPVPIIVCCVLIYHWRKQRQNSRQKSEAECMEAYWLAPWLTSGYLSCTVQALVSTDGISTAGLALFPGLTINQMPPQTCHKSIRWSQLFN